MAQGLETPDFFLIKKKKLSIVELKWVTYCCTAKWLSYTYKRTHTYTYIYTICHILFHFGLSQDVEYNSLCHTSVAQSCPTFCDLMDCSPPGSSVHGILQAKILEWVAISFSRGPSQPRNWTCISCIASESFTAEPPGKSLESQTGFQKTGFPVYFSTQNEYVESAF